MSAMEIDFGKHKGTLISVLIENQKPYCQWLLRQANLIDKPYYNVLCHAFSKPGEYYLTFGKYKGFTLTEVYDKDVQYLEWLHTNEFVLNKCQGLIQALDKMAG